MSFRNNFFDFLGKDLVAKYVDNVVPFYVSQTQVGHMFFFSFLILKYVLSRCLTMRCEKRRVFALVRWEICHMFS